MSTFSEIFNAPELKINLDSISWEIYNEAIIYTRQLINKIIYSSSYNYFPLYNLL